MVEKSKILIPLGIFSALGLGAGALIYAATRKGGVGLLPGTAYVCASNAPDDIKEAALTLKKHYGDYVQMCDNKADDLEIMAAINLFAVAGKRGSVCLSPGLFTVWHPILLQTGVTVFGTSALATKIFSGMGGPVFSTPMSTKDRWSFITLRDFSIWGDRKNQKTGNGISLHSAWSVLIQNMIIENMPETGIIFSGGLKAEGKLSSLKCKVQNTIINRCGRGFFQEYTYDTLVDDLYIDTTYSDSGAVITGGSSIFQKLHVFNAFKNAIEIGPAADNVDLIACIADTCLQHGIVVKSQHCRFIDCQGFNNSKESPNTYDGFHNANMNNVVMGGRFFDSRSATADKTQRYGISEESPADFNTYEKVDLDGNRTGKMLLTGKYNHVEEA